MCLISFLFEEVVPLSTSDAQLNPAAEFQRYDQAVAAIEATAASADDPKLLDLSLKLFDNDAGRRTSIDSRAGAMMSAITLAATLVTGVGFTAFKDTSGLSHQAFWAMFLTFILALIYLTVTAVLLFQIQGRIFRSTPDPRDVVTPPPPAADQPSPYQREVAVKMLRYTIANYKINNRVVNRLWIAQKCFRNALVILVIGGIVTTVFMVTAEPVPPSGVRLAQIVARTAGCSDLPSLAIDRNGRWAGTCLHAGKPANVVVNADGTTVLSP
jgi:hypothetical protein